MRPLETKKGKEGKKKKNQMIIGLFIAFLMIFSVVGYALLSGYQGQEQGQETYNDHIFTKTQEGWKTQVSIENQAFIITTAYLPQELENISMQGTPLLDSFRFKTLYIIANDASERQAASSFYTNLNKIALRIQLACSEEESETEFCLENELPIKSCNDATFETTIIEIKESETEEASITYKNNCIIIEGKGNELVKAAEKTIFVVFGII